MSKWGASEEAWNNNRNRNYNKALDEYNQRVADAVNDYYNNNSYSKYYFRDDDPEQEYNNVVNKLKNQDTKTMQNYLDSNFANLGGSNTWLNNYWTGNELNDLTNTYIADNYNNALNKIDTAYANGTLNDTGYNTALNTLDKQKSAANVTIGNLTKGILDDYKADLINKAQGYYTDLDNYNLNKYNTTNTANWEQDFNNYYNNQKSNLANQFNYAVNDLNLFDTADLIGNAKVNQGVTNPINNTQIDDTLPVTEYYKQYKNGLTKQNSTTNPLYDAINEQNERKSKKVGLGNVGLF